VSYNYFLDQIPLKNEQSLLTLVENRSTYTLENCELNVFETHQQAHSVNLTFNDLVLTSMLRGKKIMHLFDKPGFEYLPGESVLVPPQEIMKIDFPEARADNPTQCIALAICGELIRNTVDILNEKYPKSETNTNWQISHLDFHLNNNQELAEIINRFIRISIKDTTKEKDLIAGLALRELLVRLMQTQARQLFEANYKQMAASNRFAHVIAYIKSHIREDLKMDKLSEQACMSRSNFFKTFKQEFGYTPNEYILKEKIKLAKEYLKDSSMQVTQVCFMAGFHDLNYFIRAFKKETGLTPKAYQQKFII
jgi:AraC-like DNA-binding protein